MKSFIQENLFPTYKDDGINLYKHSFMGLVAINSLFFLYGLNQYINYLVIIFTILLIFYFINIKALPLLFFPTMFFESILVLPFGGSFFRIINFFIICYYLLTCKGKIPLYKRAPIFIIYILFSIRFSELEGFVSITITVVTLYIIYIYQNQDTLKRELVLIAIFLSAAFSALYSFRGKFTELDFVYGTRYSGTIGDPNYSALLYVIGIASALCCYRIAREIKVVSIVIILIGLIRTISVTGFFVFVLIVLFYCYAKNTKKAILFLMIFALFLYIYIYIDISPSNIFYGLHYRLTDIFNQMGEKNYDTLSSDRTSIARDYLSYFQNNVPVFQKLFGGNNTISGEFRSRMLILFKGVSHNSYIDMLYMIGYVGLLFVVATFIIEIIRCLVQYKKQNDTTFLGFALIKIVVMIFMFSLSIFPYRYFAMSFLI